MTDRDLRLLRRSIEVAESARRKGNHPFGAVLADEDGNVLLEAENTVVTGNDVTGHAETNLVRNASGTISADVLETCTLYASTEPCAMCSGAIFWGNIRRIVYALSEADLYDIVGSHDDQISLPCREVYGHAKRAFEVIGPCRELNAEARKVHEGFWS